jgi:hypothetical protein
MTLEALAILEGHIKEVFNSESKLSEERLAICKQCPLYKKTAVGFICDKYLYLNKETNETAFYPMEGFQNGCGCRLAAKSRLKDAHCPLAKW